MLDLDRPPKWGLVAIVFLVMSNILLLVLLLQPDDEPTGGSAATSAGPTSSSQLLPSPTPAAATSSVDPTSDVLAVYGDGYSEGGLGAAGWPALVAEELGMQLDRHAATLAGYAVQGSTGQTFEQLVQDERSPTRP